MAARGPVRGAAALAALLALTAGCGSPEASRVRGGGSGADVGNTGPVVSMHAGARPYHDTPCLGGPAACAGQEPPTNVARSGSQ